MGINIVFLVISSLIAFSSALNITPLISPDKIVVDETINSQNNIDRLKYNLDTAQQFLIGIYKGVYGGISAFWFYYSILSVMAAFYYTWGVTWAQAKDEAEEAIKKLEESEHHSNEIQRSVQFSSIDINSIFNKLRSIDEKTGGKLSGSCFKRGLCEVRSFVATSPIFNWMPRFIRKMLHLEPGSRDTGTCAEVHNECSVVSLLSSLIQ